MSNKFGLGRLHIPDVRDNDYPMKAVLPARASERTFRYWWPQGWWGNQGNTPQCVSYAWTHYLEDGPVTHHPKGMRTGTPFDTQQLYDECQLVDRWPGEHYDGTSVRAGAKVLQRRGLIKEYRWAETLNDVVQALLEVGPIVAGTWWTNSMFYPDEDGFLDVSGNVAGGHAYILDGVNVERRVIRMKNSWGRYWGHKGFGYFRFEDFEVLLNHYGEACIAVENELE